MANTVPRGRHYICSRTWSSRLKGCSGVLTIAGSELPAHVNSKSISNCTSCKLFVISKLQYSIPAFEHVRLVRAAVLGSVSEVLYSSGNWLASRASVQMRQDFLAIYFLQARGISRLGSYRMWRSANTATSAKALYDLKCCKPWNVLTTTVNRASLMLGNTKERVISCISLSLAFFACA